MEKQLQDFSADLASSKICFVTASRWQYSIQKYGEAAAAGCLIIGTLPLDRRDEFRKFVVEISNNDTDEHIANVVDHWLKDEQGRLEKVKLGQDWFLSKFSGRNFVQDIVGWIKLVQSGRRGLLLPYQWDFLPVSVRRRQRPRDLFVPPSRTGGLLTQLRGTVVPGSPASGRLRSTWRRPTEKPHGILTSR